MIDIITHKGIHYPSLQATGYALRFALPFALEIIGQGKTGYDIGCNRKEWSFPGSIPIDPEMDNHYDATCLPNVKVDYCLSSHCIEHLPNWVAALNHWHSKLHVGGILFLYLPNMDTQTYWRPWSNDSRSHFLNPYILNKYFEDNMDMWTKVKVTGSDLNDSFYCIAEKK